MQEILKLGLLVTISIIVLSMVILLFAAVLRRIYNSRKYRQLDELRDLYRKELKDLFLSEADPGDGSDFIAPPTSIKWEAIENVLLDLMDDENYREKAGALLDRLGYISFYEGKFDDRNVITKAFAIDKLGKMRSASSTDKLIPMLKHDDIEIVSVTVRALCKIGSLEGLKGILDRLPVLYEKSLTARKTVEAFLLNFGNRAVPMLLEYAGQSNNAAIKASLLEVLSHIRAGEALPMAVEAFRDEDPEVRAKALKVVATTAVDEDSFDWEQVIPLVNDPVWFVRLHAARALGKKKYPKALDVLGKLLLDENWRVRNAGAVALTNMADASLDTFADVLRPDDSYIRASVSEEIQKTRYVDRLIENLESADGNIREKSREILDIMCSIGFQTPLIRYMETGENEKIKKVLGGILREETES